MLINQDFGKEHSRTDWAAKLKKIDFSEEPLKPDFSLLELVSTSWAPDFVLKISDYFLEYLLIHNYPYTLTHLTFWVKRITL